jgi:carboxymethylenebutenolidase
MGKMIEFVRPDGQKAPGYLALPGTNDHAPAVVVVHELWGLNPQIQGVADKLAQDGFRALVPDLYRGKIAKDRDEGRQLMAGLDLADAASQDLRGAVQHLKSRSSAKVAVLGFCMGGSLAIIAGVNIPELDAGVCFYGIPPERAADPSKIRVPMQFHFATQDHWCNSDLVGKLKSSLARGSVPHELHIYEAQHAFMNEARPEVHAPDAAREAWGRAIAFLGANIASAIPVE